MKFKLKDINNLYKKHILYYCGGFLLCILYSTYGLPILENILPICFLLILLIGISHGALDHEKGKKLFKIYKINNIFYFYLSYILIAILVTLLWYKLPTFTLFLFLCVASYHFGKEDSIYSNANNLVLFTIKGSFIIFAPIFINYEETLNIFSLLNANNDIFIGFLNIFEPNNMKLFLIFIIFYLSLLIALVSSSSKLYQLIKIKCQSKKIYLIK